MGGDEGWPDCAISERCAEAIHKAKKEIRSELKPASWSRRGYWRPGAKELPQELDNLQRIHCRDVTPEQFFERFELPARPVVIDGFAEGTPAQHWTAESLLQKYGEMRFKCGEDDEGYPERVKLRHFMEYCTTEGQMDDSPLYVFDSRFADRGDGKTLLNDYRLPSYFRDDLFKLVGEKRRPPWRWFMIGPPRSGTGIHTDPLGTSAWNMLAQGHKRWCLFPPGTPRHLLKPDDYKGVDREAISWFQEILPRLIREHPEVASTRIDFVQRPGETVFVPGEWWHVVTNLDTTVAVTQNFSSRSNFPLVWSETVKSRPRLAAKWVWRLAEEPKLYGGCVDHALEFTRKMPGAASLWDAAPAQQEGEKEGARWLPDEQRLRRFYVKARHARKKERKEKRKRKREKKRAEKRAKRFRNGGGTTSSSSSSS